MCKLRMGECAKGKSTADPQSFTFSNPHMLIGRLHSHIRTSANSHIKFNCWERLSTFFPLPPLTGKGHSFFGF
jgi:hypothetical protein